MACTLTIQDYLSYFLSKPNEKGCVATDENSKTNGVPQGSILRATVYIHEKGGGETIFYSKRIVGGRQSEPISEFVKDLIGIEGKNC